MDEDNELRIINARKLAELKRKAAAAAAASTQKEQQQASKPEEKSDKDVVFESLYDRGDEVLQTAYRYYPRETDIIVHQLARLLKQARGKENISGGELLGLFRNLGLRFSLQTSIKIQEHGRFVDLKDKLKVRPDDYKG